MGTVIETTPATYPATVYQIEDGERADAGPLGPSNQAAIHLANRTKWLKEAMDSKAPLASPAFTGTPTAPTPNAADSSTKLATTEYVTVLDALKAPLASPAFTGTPTAPTAIAGTKTTQLATTKFVDDAILSLLDQFDCSLAASGYQILPSGLIVQWGSFSGANLSGATQWGKTAWSATLPIAFPTAGLFGFASPGASIDNGWDTLEHTLGVQSVTQTTISGLMMRLVGGPVSWDIQQILFVALGH